MRILPLVLFCLAIVSPARAETLPLSIPFDFRSTQILLKVGIGESEPGWFIVDSGASGCIVDSAVAARLGLTVEGNAQGSGAGKGTVEIRFTPNVTYTLAGTSFTVPKSYVIDFAEQKSLLGREIAGVLGYEFFQRYVVAIDFETHIMTLHDPASFSGAPGEAVPFELVKKTPHIAVKARVAGQEVVAPDVQIDSGSGDAVDIDALANSTERLEFIGGVGLGEEFRMVMGRAESASIGSFTLVRPYGATGGVQLIGNEVLRRFDVVFDYTRSRVFLNPNGDFAEPFLLDASGLVLRWTDDLTAFVVHDVAGDSPASEAGLKAGDMVRAINTQPAAAFGIDQVQRMLMADGETIRLTVESSGAARDVALTLRTRL